MTSVIKVTIAQFSLANIQLQQLEAIRYQKRASERPSRQASLQGRGTLKDPQFTATFQAPKLVIAQQTLDGLKLHARHGTSAGKL